MNEVPAVHFETYRETESMDAAVSAFNACIQELKFITDALCVKLLNPKGQAMRIYDGDADD